ncbi:MAG: DUF2141 domain-containing protein [Parvularculaceae bacterium]|nr:DUF2141 domain-containing protein [Parvularculaceae bacterium]
MEKGALFVLVAAFATAAADAADYGRYATPEAAVLAVEAPFAPPGGAVRVTVYASAETFLHAPAHKLEGAVGPDGVAVFDLAALAPGDYAFAAYFDADGDGKLKRGRLGRPKEPFVFSNNVRPTLSRPSFDETAVHAGPGEVIVMTLRD